MIDERTVRLALACVPRVAIFVYDGTLTHRFCGGDPRILTDLNLPAEGVEGLPVGFSLANVGTWTAAAEAARRVVGERVSSVLRIRFLDRHYEVHARPLDGGGGVNVICDVTPASAPPLRSW